MGIRAIDAHRILTTMPKADLEHYYAAYKNYVSSQTDLKNKVDQQACLEAVFERLPNVQLFEFATDALSQATKKFLNLDEIKNFSPLIQETLMECCTPYINTSASIIQITALLASAHNAKAQNKLFKAHNVPWELFVHNPKETRSINRDKGPEDIEVLFEAARTPDLSSLDLVMSAQYPSYTYERDPTPNLATFINCISGLTTLRLDFGNLGHEPRLRKCSGFLQLLVSKLRNISILLW